MGIDSIPMNAYPASVGHFFLCAAMSAPPPQASTKPSVPPAERHGAAVACAPAAPKTSSTTAATAAACGADFRCVAWTPIAWGPAVFVVGPEGGVSVLIPATGVWFKAKREDDGVCRWREVFCAGFAPRAVYCVECLDMGAGVMATAIGGGEGLSIWGWRGGFETGESSVEEVRKATVTSVDWLSLPMYEGLDEVAFLAVGGLEEVKIYRVSVGYCSSDDKDCMEEGLRFRLKEVWSSSVVEAGFVTNVAWWWDVSKKKQEGNENGGGNVLSVVLVYSVLNSIGAFVWSADVVDDACPPSDAPNSLSWARKLKGGNYLFAGLNDEAALLDWSSSISVRVGDDDTQHQRVVSDLAVMADGTVLSSAEDGKVYSWCFVSRERGEDEHDSDALVLSRDVALVDDAWDQPVFGVRGLHTGLCAAVVVTVPPTEEVYGKTQTNLLIKFKSGARLSRLLILAPLVSVPDSVVDMKDFVNRACSQLIEAAHRCRGVLSWDLSQWLESQSVRVREDALLYIWNTAAILEGHTAHITGERTIDCVRVLRSLVELVFKFASATGAGESLAALANDAESKLLGTSDLILYIRGCLIIEKAAANLSSAIDGKIDGRCVQALTLVERSSLFAWAELILRTVADSEGDEALIGPLSSAESLVRLLSADENPWDYLLACPVCAFDCEEPVFFVETFEPAKNRQWTVSCPNGDNFDVCALTLLPCLEASLVKCTGCEETCAREGLKVGQDGEIRGEMFSWMKDFQTCPLCCCSFQAPDIATGVVHSTASE